MLILAIDVCSKKKTSQELYCRKCLHFQMTKKHTKHPQLNCASRAMNDSQLGNYFCFNE